MSKPPVKGNRRVFLLCGSRNATEHHFYKRVLPVFQGLDISQGDVFIHGDCDRGIDRLASEYLTCSAPWPKVVPMRAQWERYGKAAGPRRNQKMLKVILAMADRGYAPALLAFPLGPSPGTRGMVLIWEADGSLPSASIHELTRSVQSGWHRQPKTRR